MTTWTNASLSGTTPTWDNLAPARGLELEPNGGFLQLERGGGFLLLEGTNEWVNATLEGTTPGWSNAL